MNYGHLAYGKCGDTQIEVDECIDRDDHFELTITVASASQTLVFISPQILGELLAFLENKEEKELGLSCRGGIMTMIRKDDEFEDRAFLTSSAKSDAQAKFRMTLDIPEMSAALKQASEDL